MCRWVVAGPKVKIPINKTGVSIAKSVCWYRDKFLAKASVAFVIDPHDVQGIKECILGCAYVGPLLNVTA